MKLFWKSNPIHPGPPKPVVYVEKLTLFHANGEVFESVKLEEPSTYHSTSGVIYYCINDKRHYWHGCWKSEEL